MEWNGVAWRGVEMQSIEYVRASTLTNSGWTDGIRFHGHADNTCVWSGILHLTSALLCAPACSCSTMACWLWAGPVVSQGKLLSWPHGAARLCYRDMCPGMMALQAVIQQSHPSGYFMKHSLWGLKRERVSTLQASPFYTCLTLFLKKLTIMSFSGMWT